MIAFNPFVSTSISTAKPPNAFPKSKRSMSDSFFVALLNMLTAVAKAIKLSPILTTPLGLNIESDCEIKSNERFNITNIAPIAITDLVISLASKLAIVFKEAAKIPKAPAIATTLLTSIPFVKFSNASPTLSNIPVTFFSTAPLRSFTAGIMFSIALVIVLIISVKLYTALIPCPMNIPFKISPIETFLVIQPRTSVIPSQILPNVLEIFSPALDNKLLKLSICDAADFITSAISDIILPIEDESPDILIPLSKAVNISPIAAVKLNIISNTPPKAPELKILTIVPPTSSKAFLTKSAIENNPLNVRLSLSAVLSLMTNFSVNFLNPSVIAKSCLDVVGGNISRKAFCIGVITLISPLKTLLKPSINLVRPPKFAHSDTILFLASELLLIASFKTLLTSVHKFLASSKSPIIVLHVVVQPDPKASLIVSINCVNVFTFVAASPAVFAILAI